MSLMRGKKGTDMKSHILALLFLILVLVGNAAADDRLYLYPECSPGKQCIGLSYGDGKTETVLATPALVLAKAEVIAASIRMDAGIPKALSIELSEEASKEFEKITRENIGKKLMVVFENEILIAPTINSAITDRRIMITRGSGKQLPFWERAPWLQEIIKESSRAGGRSVMVYVVVAAAAMISAFAFILLPRMKHAHQSDGE
jgi:hypothetical protein